MQGEGAVGGGSGGRGPRGRVGRRRTCQVALRAPMRVPKQNPDADEVASLDTQPSDMGTTARKRCHRSGRVSSRGGTRARVDARTRRTRDRRCSVRQHPRRCRRSVFATPLEVRARGSVCEAATPAVPHRIQTGAPCDPLARQKSPPRSRSVRNRTSINSTGSNPALQFRIRHPCSRRVRCSDHATKRTRVFTPGRTLAPTPRRPPCPRSGGRARG